ncbi:MAG: FtsX-like permease family protein [Promethearchaeota archaeon]
MGIFKILRKSIVFSTRSRRRFFPFVVVFGILSLATIMLLFNFENFSREGLLVHRGVVVEVSTLGNVDYSTAQDDIGPTIPGSEAIIYYRYVEFGDNLTICSINTKYHWGFSEIKPNDLVSGSFPSKDMEALISDELLLSLYDEEGAVKIFTKPVVGTRFKIGRSKASPFELRVSGIYTKPSAPSNLASGREWIFIPEAAFETLVKEENLAYNDNQIYVHSISIIASGDVFSGGTYNNVDSIAASLNLGNEYRSPIFTSKIDKDAQRNMLFLSLLSGLFGTFMVSTLYSYLITRFRRREVAVLKAMGYNNWDVRIVVLAEILVVALTGYFLGLITIQAYLWLTSPGTYFFQFVTISVNFPFIIPSMTAILSFLAVVISSIPGFFIITFRILGVRPIEIFRQK